MNRHSSTPQHEPVVHGGTDAQGAPQWDFSTNNNAAGPCPATQAALAAADARRYPDPSYTQLRNALATFHGVDGARILIGASGSELITRITCATALRCNRPGLVWLPPHAYADYAHAARHHGLAISSHAHDMMRADLIWLCAPSSPHGQALALPSAWHAHRPDSTAVLDCAYAPLQLTATPIAPGLDPHAVWQIWTPNKALGLCGIRAAYAIAPANVAPQKIQQLEALAPSWPIGAHDEALLHSWCQAATQAWLQQAKQTLQQWKRQQLAWLNRLGWACLPSETHFWIARPRLPAAYNDVPQLLAYLRKHHIKLRDCASFGLPGHVRLCAHTPPAQQALEQALRQLS